MFSGIDSLDWAHIRHAHGTSEAFPTLLRDLASERDEAWDGNDPSSALLEIWECAAHQTSIYEVTPIVLPFLIELLLIVKPKHKIILMYLFSYMANNRFYWPAGSALGQTEGIKQRKWILETQAIMLRYLFDFCSFLASDDESIRIAASHLLINLIESLSEDLASLKNTLIKQLEQEPDERVQVSLSHGDAGLGPLMDELIADLFKKSP